VINDSKDSRRLGLIKRGVAKSISEWIETITVDGVGGMARVST